jgi:hypothetical protein
MLQAIVLTTALVAYLTCFVGGAVCTAVQASVKMPQASGTVVHSDNSAVIDASNNSEGYVMVKYTGSSKARLKVLIKGPKGTEFNYDLKTDGSYEVFPLSDGNGSYNVGVYQNIEGTKYTCLITKNITASLSNEFAPFLLPNQYVNYTATSKSVKKSAELTKGAEDTLDKIAAVYDYVVNNVSYDREKAATVQSGYVPNVDQVLDKKKGICFDYASLMASMLRSQGIPTKLAIGYAGTAYHAWLDVYTPETGWIEAVVFFDGKSWKLMDPTFASGMSSGAALAKYIGDGSSYKVKFFG